VPPFFWFTFHPAAGHTAHRGAEVSLYSFMTSALDGVGGQIHALATFIPGKDPIPIVQEDGWSPWPVWTGAENFAPTGIRSPDRPARSESDISSGRRRFPALLLTLHQWNPV